MEFEDLLGQKPVQPAISLQTCVEVSHHFGSAGILVMVRDVLFHRFFEHGLKLPAFQLGYRPHFVQQMCRDSD